MKGNWDAVRENREVRTSDRSIFEHTHYARIKRE